MTTLYELAHDFRATADKLTNLELDPETIEDTLESISGDLETKATNTGMVIRNLEASAAAIKEAEAAMAARRKAIENRATRLRDYLLGNLIVAGVQKVECPYFRLSVRDNPPSVDVYEPGLIPSEFMRIPDPLPPSPDKLAIKEAMKQGKDVPGCRLTQGKRVEFK